MDRPWARFVCGDALTELRKLPAESVDCVVTSPPYWFVRDYGVAGQIGLETTVESYIERLARVFVEVRRVLKATGTLWLVIGDCHVTGSKVFNLRTFTSQRHRRPLTIEDHSKLRHPLLSGLAHKNLIGIPWRLAFALQRDGWILRSDIIWHKPNPNPEPVKDRPTRAHEYVFLFSKEKRYYYDIDALREPHRDESLERAKRGSKTRFCHPKGRNRRTVWTVKVRPIRGDHSATFPEALIEPCIRAGCPKGGIVLDPFVGSGTTIAVALKLGRNGVAVDLNPDYIEECHKRLAQDLAAGTFK